jgi:hypothetical protein
MRFLYRVQAHLANVMYGAFIQDRQKSNCIERACMYKARTFMSLVELKGLSEILLSYPFSVP